MKTCPHHGQPIVDFLGCWKCVAEERDPCNLRPSSWWHSLLIIPTLIPIRTLSVDDYEPWRRFVRSALEKLTEVEIIGEASDGAQAVQQAQRLQPDLIVLDIGLPTLNGIEAARQIRPLSPGSKIVFLTEHRDIVEAAIRSGASGYVLKSDAGRKLLPMIKELYPRKLVAS